jgi:hypothetical protein
MKANLLPPAIGLIVMAIFPVTSDAQQGVGDPVGVGRQRVTPIVVPLTGTLKEIHVGPCEHTTGRSPMGTHLMVETAELGTVNVHLGPTDRVAAYVSLLRIGEPIAVDAFETSKLSDGERIAQKVTQAGATFVLRDNKLRPVWASGQPSAYYGPRQRAFVDPNASYAHAYRGSCRYWGGEGYRGGYRNGYGWGGGYRDGPETANYGARGRRVDYGGRF